MIIGRLAPTPSGGLHLGNARTFLIAWLSARAAGGRIVLRIDDLDRPRIKPGAVEQAIEDLRWLGLDWDGEPLYQSRRTAAYEDALKKLLAAGRIRESFASRRELAGIARAPHTGDELTPGKDRAPAWRFISSLEPVKFTDAFHGDCAVVADDFIVCRNDGIVAYQLATVVDDHFQGVNEVMRGDDLLASTPRQVALARALELPSPRYIHLPLVLDANGERMAKRRDSTRLSALREAGIPANQIVGMLAASCGWAKPPGEQVTPEQLIGRFDLEKLPREPAQLTGP